MLAIVAAVLFGIALLLQLVGSGFADLLLTAGLLCLALYLGGVGSRTVARGRRR